MHMSRRKVLTVRELTSRAGTIGGKSRMANLTADERKALARKGGQVGGSVRAKQLTAERRSEIAAKAALTRWGRRMNPLKDIGRPPRTAKPKLREKWRAESEPPINGHFKR